MQRVAEQPDSYSKGDKNGKVENSQDHPRQQITQEMAKGFPALPEVGGQADRQDHKEDTQAGLYDCRRGSHLASGQPTYEITHQGQNCQKNSPKEGRILRPSLRAALKA